MDDYRDSDDNELVVGEQKSNDHHVDDYVCKDYSDIDENDKNQMIIINIVIMIMTL